MRIYKVEMTFDGRSHTTYVIGHSVEIALAKVRSFRLNAEILEIRRIDSDDDRVVIVAD